jgi:excinuclease ABC subunit A
MEKLKKIRVRGARTHNLKNLDIDLPRDELIVITGLSGSGKSSLAFDTIYAEGQRRYVESLSSYARQFLSMMEKPDMDHIEGLSPAISIQQKSTSHNPRSTVGTVTEIHDYLRLLYARAGTPRCPEHGCDLAAQTVSQMVDQILNLPDGAKIMLLAPVIRNRKGEHHDLFDRMRAMGLTRARVDGTLYGLDEVPKLAKNRKHTIEFVIDRLKVRDDIRQRLAESLETTLNLTEGLAIAASLDGEFEDLLFSENYACPECGYSLPKLEPRMFSFNNPSGACPSCDGLGIQQYFAPENVITNPETSLSNGAIRGWDRRNGWYFQTLQGLAKHYDFDLDTPFDELPETIQNVILYGSGKDEIDFAYFNSKGGMTTKHHTFEGVINNLQRRYLETESRAVREELAKMISHRPCPDCQGSRLRVESRHVFVNERTLAEVSALPIDQCHAFFERTELTGWRHEVGDKIIREILLRLNFLVNVGLDYLNLERSADTLSGGEAQRIRLASQIGAGLVGVMYVLDEPSIGLHQRDNQRLLETLAHLKELGNTVIVVEHDEDAIRFADYVVDIGPGAGVHGGAVVAAGTPAQVMAHPDSLTGQYLSGKRVIHPSDNPLKPDKNKVMTIHGASGNNLKHIDVEIPLGLFVCVTGVSGSGKSTLINETLYPRVASKLNRANHPAAPCDSISGIEHLDKIVNIDQSPIGRTPRSNPATYTGLFTPIRELFAGTKEARSRGYQPGRFSFNVKGGRCEACQGDGVIKVEMHFLADIYVPCDVCHGKRYNRETLEITYKGKTIHEVLDMTVEDARVFFDPVPTVAHKLQTLIEVGLSYIRLGQNATTLSGGEAQRIKLARELSKRDTGNTLYILDEPTTGLHFHDINELLQVLFNLRDRGNTILVIEHNLDVIKNADWIIDLGPEGGVGGGTIVATGTVGDIAQNPKSHTGRFLG